MISSLSSLTHFLAVVEGVNASVMSLDRLDAIATSPNIQISAGRAGHHLVPARDDGQLGLKLSFLSKQAALLRVVSTLLGPKENVVRPAGGHDVAGVEGDSQRFAGADSTASIK